MISEWAPVLVHRHPITRRRPKLIRAVTIHASDDPHTSERVPSHYVLPADLPNAGGQLKDQDLDELLNRVHFGTEATGEEALAAISRK